MKKKSNMSVLLFLGGIFLLALLANMYTISEGFATAATKAAVVSDPTKVRYVKIFNNPGYYIIIQELEVIDEKGVNVARTGKVTMSSTQDGTTPEIMIDGNKVDGQPWPNSTCTFLGGDQTVELDLNANVDVRQIVLYNTTETPFTDEINGATILLYNDKRTQIGQTIILTGERVQTFPISTGITLSPAAAVAAATAVAAAKKKAAAKRRKGKPDKPGKR